MEECDFVNVAIRIRPGNQNKENPPCIQIIRRNPAIVLMPDRSQTFSFDQVFDEEVNQETIYEQMVKPMVKYVKQGYNCTVFAYGQTGTGKTYTIGTEPQVTEEKNLGLIPRTLREFFHYHCSENLETEIYVSFIEIYNEKVFDLLQNNTGIQLLVKGLKPQGYCQERVFNLTEARHFLHMGNMNRHTGGTKQNAKSSRSHAIFTIHCNVKNKGSETSAKLNLVDLAGCESVKKTGSQGNTFYEGVNINKGLLSVSQVITALSTNASFIPYRQSIITSVLQDSLNKRNFITLISCVSSSYEDTTETFQTLDFAQRLKRIKSKPEVNEIVTQFKKENPNLFQFNKIGSTPFKRPALSSFQTPALTKRFRPLETTTEFNTISSEQSHSPKSLSSLSHLSAVSSIQADVTTQQYLSPLLKKYISAMEVSLMDKIEVMIKSTIKRPSRTSPVQKKEEKKVFTPGLVWSKIHTEVSKMVRTEIAQLTTNTVQATSSPLEVDELDKIRKVLKYDSPAGDTTFQLNSSPAENNDKSPVSSVTLPILTRKKLTPKRSLSISPIENIPVNPSHTPRLSRKCASSLIEHTLELNTCLPSNKSNSPTFKVPDLPDLASKVTKSQCNPKISIDENIPINPRYNLRLSTKKLEISFTNDDPTLNATRFESFSSSIRNFTNNNISETDTNQKTIEHCSRRRSIRILTKVNAMKVNESKRWNQSDKRQNKMLGIANTPAGRRLMKKKGLDSPCTTHTKTVLNILNQGNLRELEKLHSIGSKTAQQILLFRTIKGTLKTISDLSQMPGWGPKKFDRFVDLNFLKRELL